MKYRFILIDKIHKNRDIFMLPFTLLPFVLMKRSPAISLIISESCILSADMIKSIESLNRDFEEIKSNEKNQFIYSNER